MSVLVGNPEDRFSGDVTQIVAYCNTFRCLFIFNINWKRARASAEFSFYMSKDVFVDVTWASCVSSKQFNIEFKGILCFYKTI